MGADKIVFLRSRYQGFVVGVEGGGEGWRNGFLSGLGQMLQEAEIHRGATYYRFNATRKFTL